MALISVIPSDETPPSSVAAIVLLYSLIRSNNSSISGNPLSIVRSHNNVGCHGGNGTDVVVTVRILSTGLEPIVVMRNVPATEEGTTVTATPTVTGT